MDLNRVAVFVRVVDEGGFSAAARVLGLPKSSVSRSVALLEEQLGVRLLQRSTRTSSLTEAGSAFYARASAGIAGVVEAAAAVADMQMAVRGPIRITAPADVGIWLLASLVARFVQRHPGVHVDVVLTGRVVDLVDEGFDLAVRAGRLPDASLIARRLAQVDAEVYASAAYLARRGTPATIAELAHHDCVLFRPTRGRATWTFSGPGGDESVEVTGPIGVDDFSFSRAAVLAGAGIGRLPSFLCKTAVGSGELVRVLPGHVLHWAPLHLVYPSARYLPHRVATFRDFLLEHLGSDLGAASSAP